MEIIKHEQNKQAGGWESVDSSESAALTRWLESSRFLFDAELVTNAAPVLGENEKVQS